MIKNTYIVIISIAFLTVSLFLYLFKSKLEQEQIRSINIAAQLEVWKQAAINPNMSVHDLLASKNPKFYPIDNSEQTYDLQSGESLYTLILDEPDPQSLKKYSSDLILVNYFYAIIKDDRLIEMDWDKP